MATLMAQNQLHILFFPLMAPGHMLPMLNMAKLFACHDHRVRATILTTPANVTTLVKTITINSNSKIELALIPFPSTAAGLPLGCENLATISSHDDLMPNFIQAVSMLTQPFEQILRELQPNVIITDAFIPWTIDITTKLGIPQIISHGTGFFPLCLSDIIQNYKPHETLPAETKSFLVPGIPHRVELLKTQVLDIMKAGKPMLDLLLKIKDTESRSYGVVVNSFYELEPDYVQHYRTVMGRRAWHFGPVSLCNEDVINSASATDDKDHDQCLHWLDEKQPRSVLYVCFGSLCAFSGDQLREIALGLEASNHAFIWVVPKVVKRDEDMDWMPEGFEGRINIEGKQGFIIRGWAPQLLILNHKAVGGFMTHCGWNSTLEGVCAGLPMITWPLFAEQFYNERLVVDVLKIGVAVGMKEYVMKHEDRPLIHGIDTERVVNCVMGVGEEAEAMRKRARELGEMAKSAVMEDGSSYLELTQLINELSALHP
ncbi:scopoletin glucosyltransferase-like [Dioscorea cayenensis subsp. rotundata]|uniref:Glycosyltransferase n=1 Tax=Dioscorea cayennensis subsp. rotundata TaxID=55577 RepID=A0AB40CV64_DIOCR|nr:scopoletin glucosyltransferase-like [Dioscorea cayenensis subsp. rotundata]